ncbi:MAG: hypothetical protein ABSC46_01585 [Candidatus Limnocylindrales bacterium]|jgi:hypothetical protein
MRRLVAVSAILAALLTAPLGPAAATPTPSVAPTDSDRATAALEYLLVAQQADGSIDASIGETADFVIGAAAAGYDPATLQGCSGGTGALTFIATKSDDAKVVADAAQTGKAILAVVAAGGDPTAFDGRDLTARLNALYHSDTGAYGSGSTISQSYAILAVVASGSSLPVAATAELLALQGSDGGWTYGPTKEAARDGDTNSTAVALMALHAAGIDSADALALPYLKTQQVADGGFVYSTAYGSASDADSDAEVIQALLAAGQDPTGTAWSTDSGNALVAMRAAQGPDGGFAYTTFGESAFTTSEVPAALMRAPYGAAVRFTAGRSLPASACPSPTPTATATPTATPTPKPTARPTVRPTPRPAAAPTDAPTEAPADTATAEPTPTATPTETAAPTADAVIAVVSQAAQSSSGPGSMAGSSAPAGSSGGIPAPVVYMLAALAGMVIVVGGGWLLLSRQAVR